MKKAILVTFFGFISLLVISCDNPANENTQEAKYSVSYVGNGNTSGYVPVDNKQYLSGEVAIILGKGSLDRIGYDFSNWNTNQQGNGVSYNPSEIITIGTSNVTLYAIWVELSKYTVTFETYGGSYVPAINNIISGSKISKPTNPTKENCTFQGWFIDEEFDTEWDFQNNIVENNITLFAKWYSTLYQYEVSIDNYYRVGSYIAVYWTNPIDDNFSHVRIIPAGFEWVESMGGAAAAVLDKEPGITYYVMQDNANTEYLIIKCIGKDGTVSEGITVYFN